MAKQPIENTTAVVMLLVLGVIVALCIYTLIRVDGKRADCVERGGVPVTLMFGRVACTVPPSP